MDVDLQVEFAGGLGGNERVRYHAAQRFRLKIVLKSASVDDDLAVAGGQPHPRNTRLAAAGAKEFPGFWVCHTQGATDRGCVAGHYLAAASESGCCAACGCALPL